jgi:SMC interacting uncharacterized protein involved in chromosome segregation
VSWTKCQHEELRRIDYPICREALAEIERLQADKDKLAKLCDSMSGWNADDVRHLESERDDLRGNLAGMQVEWDDLKAENLRLQAEQRLKKEMRELNKLIPLGGVDSR